MKFKYLGTAAAEGWPAMFCSCDACNRARTSGLHLHPAAMPAQPYGPGNMRGGEGPSACDGLRR